MWCIVSKTIPQLIFPIKVIPCVFLNWETKCRKIFCTFNLCNLIFSSPNFKSAFNYNLIMYVTTDIHIHYKICIIILITWDLCTNNRKVIIFNKVKHNYVENYEHATNSVMAGNLFHIHKLQEDNQSILWIGNAS